MIAYAKRYARKCYQGIDTLPIFNWWQHQASNDMSYLLKEKSTPSKLQNKALEILWTVIVEEYVRKIGFGEKFKEIFYKRKKIAELMVTRITTGEDIHQTFIDIAEVELKELLEENAGVDQGESHFYEMKGFMEKVLGFYIDIKKVSVLEFHGYVKVVEKNGRK